MLWSLKSWFTNIQAIYLFIGIFNDSYNAVFYFWHHGFFLAHHFVNILIPNYITDWALKYFHYLFHMFYSIIILYNFIYTLSDWCSIRFFSAGFIIKPIEWCDSQISGETNRIWRWWGVDNRQRKETTGTATEGSEGKRD